MEENNENWTPPCLLPERIFAVGEEPTGVRVTPYHKAGAIREILNALDAEEIEQIRALQFGKLVDIADKPTFSGRFGRYMMSRQLKVSKKYEVWFLFAGKPIRFSIREFALVTGLNCSNFPRRSKKKSKNFLSEKPYWGELFGSLKEVPVSSVVKMLEKRTIVDKEIRLKYAFLSLLAAVILPTTHSPRISEEYAERIKDLDAFLAYPWGMVSFDMLISSIKERKEVALSQNTIAVKGFVLAMQLVFVECVPALTEVVQEASSSGSDGDDDTPEMDKDGKKSISPGHARDTDAAGKALVESIMLDGNGDLVTHLPAEYQRPDEEDDIGVSNMLKLIEEGYPFSSRCFVGGSTKQDVARMREEAKAEMLNRKTVKSKIGGTSQSQEGMDIDMLASIVRDKLKDDFQHLHGSIANIQEAANGFTETILVNINDVFSQVQEYAGKISNLSEEIRKLEPTSRGPTVERAIHRPSVADAGTQTTHDPTTIISAAVGFANQSNISSASGGPPDESVKQAGEGGQSSVPGSVEGDVPPISTDSGLDPSLDFPDPTFSLGLTQEGRLDPPNKDTPTVEGLGSEGNLEECSEEGGYVCRKSKRQRVPTKSLLGEYQCDKTFLNRARKAVADAIYKGGDIDYSNKFAVLKEKLVTSFAIKTDGGDIQSTDIVAVLDRGSQLSPKVVDFLVFHTSTLFRSQASHGEPNCPVFMDTLFVSQFTKIYPKFSKAQPKNQFKFSGMVVDKFVQVPEHAVGGRFYFPFCLDKKYWVGICVDCTSWTVTILDSNISLRTDYMMNREVRPIASMFPYFLKQVGREVGSRDCKAMAIERPRTIPQQNQVTQSAVSTLLFIQAHAVGGINACKCITPDVMDSQVERLVVSLYEAFVGTL